MRQTRSRLGCLSAPRGRQAGRALSAALAFLLAWLQGIPPSFSAEFRVFRKTYLRAAGAPDTVADSFGVLNPNTTWTLRAINGSLEDTSVEKVSSSTVTLNGIEVLRPNQFNQNVGLIEVPVIVLSSNTVATQLRSKPGGQLTVEIVGQDTTPPTAQWLAPSPGQFLNTATVSAQLRLTDDIAGLDPASLQILLDAGSVLTAFNPLTQPTLHATLNASLAIAAEGTHTLRAEVRDLAGLLASASVSFTVDRTPPVITNLTPTNGLTLNTPRPTITASFSDQLSGVDASSVRLSLDGRDVTAQATVTAASISFAPTADLADGTHTAQLRVADRAGNLATAQTTFTILTSPPVTPQSGFIHGQVFDALDQPLSDARITVRGIVGEVRSSPDGRYQFPTPGSGDFIVNVTKAGFTSVQWSISVLATRDVAVAPVYLTPLDAKVTLITPGQGGVATDSSGTFQVEFPPGAAPRDLPVTITPLTDERQLPGPIKEDQGHIAAVYFEPRFTTFNTPATLRVRNTLGLPRGTAVNLQLWHEDAQQWRAVEPGQVTADGQWIEFRIIRFFCWYCLWLNRVLPPRTENPQQPTATSSEVHTPALSCDLHGNSAICLASGSLSESHRLPALRTLGASRTLTFTYRSSTANPSVLLGTDYVMDPLRDGAATPIPIPATTTATIQIEGRLISASFQGASGALRQAALWDGKNARDQLLSTGAYPYTVTLSNDYDATLGATGLPALGRSTLTTTVRSRAILVNERASPFGAGWSLEGLARLSPQPDGTLLLTDGNGSATVFRPGPFVDLAVLSASTDDVSVLSGHGDGTFQPPQRFILGLIDPPVVSDGPLSVASGDFNEDGRPDVAVTLSRTGEVALMLGQGRGTLAAPARIAVEPQPRIVAVADFNRDGHDDLAVVSESADVVAVLLGNGDGTFQPKRLVATGHVPVAMAVGDLNGDGIPDLVVVNVGSQDATVLLGVGDGTFRPAPSLPVGRSPVAVVLGDFNGDHLLDVVVSNSLDGRLSLFLGRGDGTFQPPQLVPLPSHSPGALAVSDFNRDGRSDVAVADFYTNTVTILLGNGDATFQRLPDIRTGQGPIALVVGDVNQDGLQDLVTANSFAGSVSCLLGNGDGTFQRQREIPVGFDLVSLVFGKFDDRRGDPDQVFSGLPGDFSQVRKHTDGTSTRQLTNGTQIAFDARGLHTRTIDRNLNETRYTYDAQDRLIRIEMPGAAAFDLRYDPANGQVSSITDASGRTTQVLVDSVADLRRITNPDGTTRQFTYDAEHRLIAQTNERGFTTDYVYDDFGRLKEAVLPERLIFDPTTGVATPQREISHFTPSETQGLINSLPPGTGTSGNPAPPVVTPLARFQDGQGNTTQLLTDHFGAPTKVIDPLGRTTRVERDVNGLPVRITQPDGAQTVMLYDSRGNLTLHIHRLIDPRSTASFTPLITRFAYDPRFSQVTQITDARRDSPFDPLPCPQGCTTRIEYDAQGNPSRIIDHLGNVTSFTYDSRGLLLTVTDALGTLTPPIPGDHQTRFTYDPISGNLVTTTEPLGRVTALAYDPFGNVTTSTDPQLHTTTFTYDAMNRLRSVADAAGGTTPYDYDAAGNLSRVTDANAHATNFTYDSLNRLATTTNPANQTKSFFYDANRNLGQLLDAKGQAISFSYDAANQLKTKILKDVSGAIQDTVTYDYDSLGNLTLVQDADSKLIFAYDSAGRLIQAGSGDASNPAFAQVATTIQYGYDPNGNRTSFSCPVCLPTIYRYDGLNRVDLVHAPNLVTKAFEYDALSRLTRQFFGPPTTFTYDDASHLRSLHTLLAGVIDEQVAYTYDRLGNRTSLTDRFGLHQYGYDALNRLTSAAHPLASGLLPETFTYDPVGNRTTSHLSTLYRYEAANRLLEDDQFTYTYDANGNLTSKTTKALPAQVTQYAYDIENQLVRIDLPDGRIAQYRYDGLGRRIEKNVSGTIQRFLYDQEDLVALFSGPANCQTHVVLHGPGIDQPLAFLKDTNGDCNPFFNAVGFVEPIVYLQTDGLGSPTSLVSETGGFFRSLFLAERYTYDSFGQPTITAPDGTPRATSAFGNPYLFTGREYDSESGLYYHRGRYRDPGTGRFLQEDPLGILTSPNLYSYVANNPVTFVDPWGLEIEIHGSSEYRSRVQADIERTRSGGPEGKALVEVLEKSPRKVTITNADDPRVGNFCRISDPVAATAGVGSDATIGYDPTKGQTVTGDKRPPFIGLSHEMGHARDSVRGAIRTGQTNGINNAEIDAVRVENKIRGEHGLPARTTYGGRRIP